MSNADYNEYSIPQNFRLDSSGNAKDHVYGRHAQFYNRTTGSNSTNSSKNSSKSSSGSLIPNFASMGPTNIGTGNGNGSSSSSRMNNASTTTTAAAAASTQMQYSSVPSVSTALAGAPYGQNTNNNYHPFMMNTATPFYNTNVAGGMGVSRPLSSSLSQEHHRIGNVGQTETRLMDDASSFLEVGTTPFASSMTHHGTITATAIPGANGLGHWMGHLPLTAAAAVAPPPPPPTTTITATTTTNSNNTHTTTSATTKPPSTTGMPGYNHYTVSYPRTTKMSRNNFDNNSKSIPPSAHDYFTSHFKERFHRQQPQHHQQQQQQYPHESEFDHHQYFDQYSNNHQGLETFHQHGLGLDHQHMDSIHNEEEGLSSILDEFLVEDPSGPFLNHHYLKSQDFIIDNNFQGKKIPKSSMPSSSSSSSLLMDTFLADDSILCTNSNADEEKMNKVSSIQSLVPTKFEQNTDDKDVLSSFSITINSLSMEPLSAFDILEKVECRCKEVMTKYLPCVEFLVLCQQELRMGLETAMGRRRGGGYAMSTGQFYNTYFTNLPNRFYLRNNNVMPPRELTHAYRELEYLLADVRKMEKAGKYEGMKNAFLGGMRDGESWGLRKWLSKNGGALNVCNDIELIWSALKQQDKNDKRVKEIARRVRPKLRYAYDKLKMEVPKAYQEVSSAHPYLPFFHRLESALKGLSEFDPGKEDIISLDDSDDESDAKSQCNSNDVIKSMVPLKSARIEDYDEDSDIEIIAVIGARNQEAVGTKHLSSEDVQDDEQSGIESALPEQLWRCKICTYKNKISQSVCIMCDSKHEVAKKKMPIISNLPRKLINKNSLVDMIDRITSEIEEGPKGRIIDGTKMSNFWSNPANYVVILRSLRNIILCKSSNRLMDPVALYEDVPDGLNKYYATIKNPLGFCDIVDALVQQDSDETTGQLKIPALRKWNMREGKWLIQAIDLVMLNALAFTGKEPSALRDEITALRKRFW
eukprot:CAMPEP_0176504998 /NCGR_PEP_ID=MMETSP0200_2-20121128/16252_1 /TAXON_ID=947934 /ORGANISM="Chaetoceros sp., Strain GSL56" /LENGTH=978 /DNA_ID=CAMNT_0017904507 /DNA_START=252 /DNA_END=3185 /DNA_ORIENTATION=-